MGRTTCIFSGHVQGVGFRYTARATSESYAVTGYVRNLGDGRVELVMEGSSGDREAMLDDIRARMGDYISDEEITESAANGEFRTFGVR